MTMEEQDWPDYRVKLSIASDAVRAAHRVATATLPRGIGAEVTAAVTGTLLEAFLDSGMHDYLLADRRLEPAEATLMSIADLAKRATAGPIPGNDHAAGYALAMGDVLKVIGARRLPPGEPVILGPG
jgi:hypothetical protein